MTASMSKELMGVGAVMIRSMYGVHVASQLVDTVETRSLNSIKPVRAQHYLTEEDVGDTS